MFSFAIIESALELGCIYALVAMALYLSFRVLNIADMTNKSRGDYAYALLDLDAPVTADVVEKLSAIEDVIKVRVIK